MRLADRITRQLLAMSLVLGASGAGCGEGASLSPGDAEVAGDSAAADSRSGVPRGGLFDPARVVEVDITLAPEDWDALRAESRTVFDVIGPGCLDQPVDNPFNWYRADATIDGVTVAAVAVRKKGFLGSLDEVRPSLKLRLDRYASGQTAHGTDRLTLNNGRQDPSRFATCLSYMTFSAAGVPAPRCNLAHVTVNGSDLGIYANVEDVKKAFLRRHFDEPLGDLYEGALSDFRPGWLGTFTREIDKDTPAGGVLDRVTEALQAPDEGLLAALRDVIDLDEALTLWAVEVLIGHRDGYTASANNFFVYEDGPGGLAALLPWGADTTFRPALPGAWSSAHERLDAYIGAALPHRLWGIADGRALVTQKLRAVLASAWDEAALLKAVDTFEGLARSRHGDAKAEAAAAAAVEDIRVHIQGRRAALEGSLAQPAAPAPELRPTPCLSPGGSISGDFTTGWGTLSQPNYYLTGTVSVSVDTAGVTGDFTGGGSRAGWDPYTPGMGLLQAIADTGAGTVLLVELRVGEELIGAGASAAFDFIEASGFISTLSESLGPRLVGLIANGGVTFTTGGTAPGDRVEATFSGDILTF